MPVFRIPQRLREEPNRERFRRKRSMRLRLFAHMLIAATALLAALTAGLFLMGKLSSEQSELADTLRLQMDVFENDMESYWEGLMVSSMQLSEETSFLIEDYLTCEGLSFEELNGSSEAVESLERQLFPQLIRCLDRSSCSGVFVVMNASVNASNAPGKSRCGLYLQSNQSVVPEREMILYRGNPAVAKEFDITLHRKWKLEFSDRSPAFDEALGREADAGRQECRLSSVITLPGTSESALLVIMPLALEDGTVCGFCGMEVSQNYFKTNCSQPTRLSRLTCIVCPKSDEFAAHGMLSSGVQDGYYFAPKGTMTPKGGSELVRFSDENESYLGLIRSLTLQGSDMQFDLAIMIPQKDYGKKTLENTLQMSFIFATLVLLAAICCVYFTNRFLVPINESIDRIKSDNLAEAHSDLQEIDDLFSFLANKDREHESALEALEESRDDARREMLRAQDEQEKAERARAAADQEVERLAYLRSKEVDPDDYRHFLEGLRTLTPTEQKIFAYYLSGKTVKEIMELAHIKESTLRYHNRNIYCKLGVNSLKQMLRYAALMTQQRKRRNK